MLLHKTLKTNWAVAILHLLSLMKLVVTDYFAFFESLLKILSQNINFSSYFEVLLWNASIFKLSTGVQTPCKTVLCSQLTEDDFQRPKYVSDT